MDLISELETEFEALSEQPFPHSVSIRSSDQHFDIRLPQIGANFVAGLNGNRVMVFPLSAVTEIRGSQLPAKTVQSLEDFLSRQRTPVRLSLRTLHRSGPCWLLNIQSGWLRVTVEQEVVWIPLEAVESLEIMPVDKSFQD